MKIELEGKHTTLTADVYEATSTRADLARYDAAREAGEMYPADWYRASLYLNWKSCLIASHAGVATQDGVEKPWPLSFEDYLEMDRTVRQGWEEAVLEENPDWRAPSVEGEEAEKKGDGTPEKR